MSWFTKLFTESLEIKKLRYEVDELKKTVKKECDHDFGFEHYSGYYVCHKCGLKRHDFQPNIQTQLKNVIEFVNKCGEENKKLKKSIQECCSHNEFSYIHKNDTYNLDTHYKECLNCEKLIPITDEEYVEKTLGDRTAKLNEELSKIKERVDCEGISITIDSCVDSEVYS